MELCSFKKKLDERVPLQKNNMADSLVLNLKNQFGSKLISIKETIGEVTIVVSDKDCVAVCEDLKNIASLHFEQLLDLCGVDYLHYGIDEWNTKDLSSTGFSRGVKGEKNPETGRLKFGDDLETEFEGQRFASVMHLISYKNNQRLRVRVFAEDNDFPVVPSVNDIWNSANWYEREAFDMFGIMYQGHPDLRRILTDYGFVGHPFRKDFPLIGNVEMRFDPELNRVIYEPVSIEPRVLVPKTIRLEERNNHTNEAEGGE